MEETKTDYVLMKETEQNKRALLREDKCADRTSGRTQ